MSPALGIAIVVAICWLVVRVGRYFIALEDLDDVLSERFAFQDNLLRGKALLALRGHLLTKRQRKLLENWIAEKEIGL